MIGVLTFRTVSCDFQCAHSVFNHYTSARWPERAGALVSDLRNERDCVQRVYPCGHRDCLEFLEKE